MTVAGPVVGYGGLDPPAIGAEPGAAGEPAGGPAGGDPGDPGVEDPGDPGGGDPGDPGGAGGGEPGGEDPGDPGDPGGGEPPDGGGREAGCPPVGGVAAGVFVHGTVRVTSVGFSAQTSHLVTVVVKPCGT